MGLFIEIAKETAKCPQESLGKYPDYTQPTCLIVLVVTQTFCKMIHAAKTSNTKAGSTEIHA